MRIVAITLYHLKMKMKNPFKTSFGTVHEKEFFLLEAQDENGLLGYGESVAFAEPWYTEETIVTVRHMLDDFIIPKLLGKEISHPDEITEELAFIKRNPMAKSTIEGAYWDLYAQQQEVSLSQAIGGTASKIDVGIAIGIQPNLEAWTNKINAAVAEGYKRIKIKIKPGQDIEVVKMIRSVYPVLPLMVDANSAYTLEDMELLKNLDKYNLLMIEQPLASDDLVDHAVLQKAIETPICLDESITSFDDARRAISLGSCQVINIKIGRVGGISTAVKIHGYCQQHAISVWCGGMLEAGIGRAHNIALTSLPHFHLPGDTAGSSHYWMEDIITPEVKVVNGEIAVPSSTGRGFNLNWKVIHSHTVSKKVYSI